MTFQDVLGRLAFELLSLAERSGRPSEQGVEITIKMNKGGTIAIVQALAPNQRFAVGDRVRVLYGSENTRVTH